MKYLPHLNQLREEHRHFLELATRIEKLLESASSSEFSERLKSLKGVAPIKQKLIKVRKHCKAANHILQSTYQPSLQPQEHAGIDREHGQLIRLVTSFEEELKLATADRTMAMILPGMDLVKWLRAHVAFEREMLSRISGTGARFKKVVSGKKPGTPATGDMAQPRVAGKPAHVVSHTIESHPKL